MEDAEGKLGPPAKKSRLNEEPSANFLPALSTGAVVSENKAVSRIREEEVGITQYLSPHPGIFAILKQRYTLNTSSIIFFLNH